MARKLSKMEFYQEEQVLLSKERTIMSFMQVGLAFVTAGLVIAGFFKETSMMFAGYVLVLIGFTEVAESIRRLLSKQKEMDRLKIK